ncbi:hypothetical protein ACJJTC_008122 [Scirpophaga incertulas]
MSRLGVAALNSDRSASCAHRASLRRRRATALVWQGSEVLLFIGYGKDLLLVQCTCMRHKVEDTLCLDQVVARRRRWTVRRGAGTAARGRFLSQDWFALHHFTLH